MSIEEKILNDNSCSPYVDKGRGYVEIAFKDGAYWGYEKGCKDMIEKACEWLKLNAEYYVVTFYDIGELDSEGLLMDFRKAMEE